MRDCKTKRTPKTNDAECIVSLKVYDCCKRKVRLSPLEIGSARSVENVCIGEEYHEEGDLIQPPEDAVSVSVDNFKIKRIVVENKQPNTSKAGYWDLNIKFVFEYQISFEKEAVCEHLLVQEEEHCSSKNILATSSYNMMVTLFGSHASDFTVGTDLMKDRGERRYSQPKPCVRVNSSASLLQSELEYSKENENSSCEFDQPSAVHVTIELVATISLYRLATSKGGLAWLGNAPGM